MTQLDPQRDAIAALNPRNLSGPELATRARHNAHVAWALQAVLRKPAITQDDIVRLLYEAKKEGVITEDEAGMLFNRLPRDLAHLKPVLHHLHQVVIHAGTLLRAELHHRGGALH